MTTPASAVPNYLVGAGYLLAAPLGTAQPTPTVAGSVFTDTWPSGWINLGATGDGVEFTSSISVEAIDFAEFTDHVAYVTTGRDSSVKFSLGDITAENLQIVMNGGTLTTTGSTTTTLNVFTPPTPGQEVRRMIGWQSLDGTVRLVIPQAINSGDMTVAFKKAPDKALLPCEFKCELASGLTYPFKWMTAGAAR